MTVNEAPRCPQHTEQKLRTVPRRGSKAAYQYCPLCRGRKFETAVSDYESRGVQNSVDSHRRFLDQ